IAGVVLPGLDAQHDDIRARPRVRGGHRLRRPLHIREGRGARRAAAGDDHRGDDGDAPPARHAAAPPAACACRSSTTASPAKRHSAITRYTKITAAGTAIRNSWTQRWLRKM